ncbi:MAG TPA: hypothetical protein VFG73_09440 [Rhodanobacteraceae bacterium]|nr:hypothetical protein [Rhodanobacteraceae bacterium]
MSRTTARLLLFASLLFEVAVFEPAMATTTHDFSTDTIISGPVVLSDDTVYQSTNGSSITFASTVDGNYSLTVTTTGSGAVTFDDEVGASTALTGLTTRSGTLSVNSLKIDGPLSLATLSGVITEPADASFVVTGASSFDSGTNSIMLSSTGNDFQGDVSVHGGVTTIADVNALTLGVLETADLTVSSGGALNLGGGSVAGALEADSSGGAVQQSGGLVITGDGNITAGNGTIALTDAGNDFQGAVSATGGGIALADVNDLTVASLADNANGSVSLAAGGSIGLPPSGINAGAGNLTVTADGGTLFIAGQLAGADIGLTGHDGVTVAADINAAGALALSSTNAAIAQAAGVITAGGATTVDAGSGAITLSGPTNSLEGPVSAHGSAVSIANSMPLALATVVSSGDLTLSATGGVTNAVDLTFGNGGTTGYVADAYIQGSTSSLSLHADALTADQLAVGGTATLGGTLNLAFASAPSVGQSFTILTAAGIADTFATVNATGLAPSTQAKVTYHPDNVQLQIEAAPATHFSLSAPTPVAAGTSASGLTVTALDASGNPATGYTGSVHFTSTDGRALLPADTALANGTGSFSFTLNSAGNQTITATDTVSPGITGTSNTIAVDLVTQTITFTSTPPTAVVGESYEVSASATSGLAVTFSIDAAASTGACTISGSTVSFTGGGTCIIDADQAGNALYAAAPQVQQIMAVQAPAIPTPLLDRWALLLLGALVGLLGFARARAQA